MRWLRMDHVKLDSNWFFAAYWFIVVGSVVGMFYSLWAIAPLYLVMFSESALARKHELLRPWCPFCRPWGRGDDGLPEVAPTPDPSGVKVS